MRICRYSHHEKNVLGLYRDDQALIFELLLLLRDLRMQYVQFLLHRENLLFQLVAHF